MSSVLYPNGRVDVAVSADIKIFTEGTAKIYYKLAPGNLPRLFTYQQDVTNQEVTLTPGSTYSEVRIEAGVERVYYEAGSAPELSVKTISQVASPAAVGDTIEAESLVRNTIADSGTVTVAQHRDQVLYQDASGGAVTMTSATAANLATEFADLAIGNSVKQYAASNHATNTSTISGGTGVTLVGSGAVVNTGGTFLLIKTAAATFDLVRVG